MHQLSQLCKTSLACALAVCLCTTGPAAAVAPGATAPGVELPGLGSTVRLADYRGKVVYLDFWASWCGPCRQSFPWMNEVQMKFAGQGFQVIAVNLDTRRSDADRFLAAVPANFTLAFDSTGGTPKLYGVKAMPTSVLIGRDGKVVARHSGFVPSDTPALERQILEALRSPP